MIRVASPMRKRSTTFSAGCSLSCGTAGRPSRRRAELRCCSVAIAIAAVISRCRRCSLSGRSAKGSRPPAPKSSCASTGKRPHGSDTDRALSPASTTRASCLPRTDGMTMAVRKQDDSARFLTRADLSGIKSPPPNGSRSHGLTWAASTFQPSGKRCRSFGTKRGSCFCRGTGVA